MKSHRVFIVILLLALSLSACSAAGAPNGSADRGATYDSEAPMPPTGEAPAEASGGDATYGADSESAPITQAQLDRKIIYTGYMQLRVEDARVAANEIVGLAMRFGGYVSQSNMYESGTDGVYQGEVQLRVNSESYQDALTALRALGTEVLSEESESSDVTDQYVDVQARVDNLKRTEAEIQALLAESRQRGADAEEILAIYRELTSIREQIERYQGQLNVLDDQTSLATITVSLVPPEAQVQIVDEGWSFTRVLREAARDLSSNLQGFAEALAYFAIVWLPVLLLWALALYVLFLLFRWVARRMASLPRPATIPPLRDAAPPATVQVVEGSEDRPE